MQLDTVLVATKPAQEAQEGGSDLVMASAAMSSFVLQVACSEAKINASVVKYSSSMGGPRAWCCVAVARPVWVLTKNVRVFWSICLGVTRMLEVLGGHVSGRIQCK